MEKKTRKITSKARKSQNDITYYRGVLAVETSSQTTERIRSEELKLLFENDDFELLFICRRTDEKNF